MQTIAFSLDKGKGQLNLHLEKQEGSMIDFQRVIADFQSSEYQNYKLAQNQLKQAISVFNQSEDQSLDLVVAEKTEAAMDILVSNDLLTATLSLTTASGSQNPSELNLMRYLQQQGVVFGISTPILKALVKKANEVAPTTTLKVVVAKGEAPGDSQAG